MTISDVQSDVTLRRIKKEHLATHKDNAFSGVESRYINTTMEVRVTKKRKGNDMQSIGETFSEEPGF